MTKTKKPSKYRNVPTEYNGVRYQSKAEAKQAYELDLRLKAGVIRGWTRQTRFMLGVPENVYVVDFVVWLLSGSSHAIDVKGVRTSKFNRDVKLWERYAPIPLVIVTGGRAVETIVPECIREAANV